MNKVESSGFWIYLPQLDLHCVVRLVLKSGVPEPSKNGALSGAVTAFSVSRVSHQESSYLHYKL